VREQPPAWARDYIGIPFRDLGRDRQGCDCWGHHRLILMERAGILLPDEDRYEGTTSKEDGDVIEGIIKGGLGDYGPRIEPGAERCLDGILFRIEGYPMHVGTVLAPGVAIHCIEGSGARLMHYRLPRYRHIVLGFYRHQSLLEVTP
jgi:cell wall-associated NlpC family hydrolase